MVKGEQPARLTTRHEAVKDWSYNTERSQRLPSHRKNTAYGIRRVCMEKRALLRILYSSGPPVRNSNLGLVLIPFRASQSQYNFLWSVSYWSGWKKSQFLVVSNFLPRWWCWHALWLVKLRHASITCSLRHPILSLSILNVILFGAIYVCSSTHTLRHLNRCQQMLLVHNERNAKRGGPLIFGRFKSVQHNQTLVTYIAVSDLLISYLPVPCRVTAVFQYDFLGWNS